MSRAWVVRSLWLVSLLALGKLACSFPEHDFIPADEFEKLKHDASAGGFGGVSGEGGTGAVAGKGGESATGGIGASGGSGGTGGSGAESGTGGVAATGGAAGEAGVGATGGVAGVGGVGASGGVSGTGGVAGSGGTSGTAGVAGSGGTSGTGATGGVAGSSGSAGASGSAGSSGSCGASIVVNEVSPEGATASDEYVELYNSGTCTVILTGWTLKYSASSGSTPATRWTGATTDSLASGAYFVVGGSGFSGTKQGSLSSGLSKDGGAVGIYNASGVRLDSISYQVLLVPNPLTETAPAANIPPGKSGSRIPDGTDTNDNSVDFKVPAARTPGAANSL